MKESIDDWQRQPPNLAEEPPRRRTRLDNFELTETPTPEPGDGEVLMRIIYLSLDPYMRGRMNATKSYAPPAAIGQPMVGGTVGEIVRSRNPKYSVGDQVLGNGGWQEYALSDGAGLRKLDPKAAPVSTALGVKLRQQSTNRIGAQHDPKPILDQLCHHGTHPHSAKANLSCNGFFCVMVL